jgi:hypothetical protein
MEATNTENYLVHESGIKYLPTYGPGAKTKLKCFGQVLSRPTYKNVEEFKNEIANLPMVESVPVYDEKGKVIPNFKQIREVPTIENAEDGFTDHKVYSCLSPNYKPVQDAEIIGAFAKMAEDRGLDPIGRIERNTGHTRAYTTFHNPETIVKLLEESEDNLAVGVRVMNSHKGDGSWGYKFFGVRMWCCNFNAWGVMLGQMKSNHFATPEKMSAAFYAGIEDALDKTPHLVNMAHVLTNTFLKWDEAIDLAWGAGATPIIAEQIGADITPLVPEFKAVDKTTVSAYDIWNALTAGATWGTIYNGETLETRADGAEKLWYEKHDDLIEKGRVAKAKYQEKLKGKKLDAEVIKVAAI